MDWRMSGAALLALFAAAACGGDGDRMPKGPLWPPEERPFVAVTSLGGDTMRLIDERLARMLSSSTREELQQRMRDQVLARDVDGDGLSESDFTYSERRSEAQRRMSEIREAFSADVDLDGRLSRAELRRARAVRDAQAERIRATRIGRLRDNSFVDEQLREQEGNWDAVARADADGDGFVTLEEAYLHVPPQKHPSGWRYPVEGMTRFPGDFEIWRVLDFNRDGVITRREVDHATNLYLDAAERSGIVIDALRSVDPDTRPTLVADEASEAKPDCTLPKASPAARLVSLSIGYSDTLSTVSVVGQDETTTTSEVTVEPGDQPLFIVASGGMPHIWRFKGAVHRIEGLILTGEAGGLFGLPATGQTGVPAALTRFARSGCVKPDNHSSEVKSGAVEDRFKRHFGREADDWINPFGVIGIGVAIPSGTTYARAVSRPHFLRASGNADLEAAWKSAVRFKPGGVVPIDARQVVASAPAEPYEVLPEHAGLAQLLKAGAISNGMGSVYHVRRPIRLPAGLSGALAVSFLLNEGVPEPTGKSGHSCVYRSLIGRILSRRCH